MKPIIEVSNLYKKYKYGESQPYYTLRDTIAGLLNKRLQLLSIGKKYIKNILNKDEFWALEDISFNVNQGEAVGIIGRNGAGKSTLLKILSQITPPTSGQIILRGRVSSLLEVGTGFQQELTGRENIYLNGAILGMSRREINRKFDEIVDFSGVEKFLDTPVKHYSSGMYARLAFAVAAHLESDVLIVDEVLAVGDSEFQKKCLRKMNNISNKEGRTVLFVSHNLGAVEQLCKKCILLDKGKIEKIGLTHDVIGNYFSPVIYNREKPSIDKFRNDDVTDTPIHIESVYVKGRKSETPIIEIGKIPQIVIEVVAYRDIAKGNITLTLFNSEGIKTDMAFSLDDGFYLNVKEGRHEITFIPHVLSLPPGRYTIAVGLNQSYNTVAWDGISYYPIFEIENHNNIIHWPFRPWAVHHSQNNKWKIK